MSVRALDSAVVSNLSALLKPQGFGREGATFSRERAHFVERFAVNGSRWNSGQEPWEFTVEIGVFFPELAPLPNAKGLWRRSHAVGSTASVLKGSAAKYEVSSSTVEAVSAQVGEVILASSLLLPSLVEPARKRAANGLASFLPLPSTWSESGAET